MTPPDSTLLQSSLRRIDRDALEGFSLAVGPERLHETVDAVVSAIERSGPLPDELVQEPALRGAARRVEQLLFSALAVECVGLSPERAVVELLPLLRGLARVREQLDDPEGEEGGSRALPFGAESVELAHDLRSPLTSILFLADTLRRGQSGPVNELQHRQLAIIYSASLGLVSLANDVIGLAHQADHLLDRQPSCFSIRELFESIVDLVQPLADERKLAVRLLVHTNDYRMGHPTVLSRVFLNLTTNALKYTEKGMVELIARSTAGDGVQFSVRDTGNGLDAEAAAQLFEPFRQRSGDGRLRLDTYGLGLTICRKLVRALGSDLHYETGEGWGTRFFFEVDLPVADPN